MNRENVLYFLISIMGSIQYVDQCLEELARILSSTGFETKFFNILIARLHQLSTKGVHVTELKEFENIRDGLYSMHLSSKGFNIRILFAFLPNREPVLLCAFQEKWGKSKTSYDEYIPRALNRLRAI